MRKLKLFFAFLLMAVLSIGQMWAVNQSFAFSTIGSTGWTNSYANHNVTCTDGTVSMNASKQTSNITDIPVTKGQPVSFVLSDNTKSLSAVSFECRQWTTKAQTITLHYSTNGGSSYTSTGITSSNFSISSSSLPTGTNAVKITFSTTNNQVGIASMSYTLATVQEPTVTATSVELENTAYEDQVVALTYSNLGGVSVSNVTATLYDNEECTTAFTGGWLNDVKVASNKQSVSFDASANTGVARVAYMKIQATVGTKSPSAIISISQAKYSAPTGIFELFSGDIEEGDYVIYYGGGAMNTTVSSNRLQYLSVTPVEDKIENPDEAIIWHISASGDYWTLYNTAAEKYAGGTSTKNQGAVLASVTDYAKWSITGSSTYDFENLGRATGSSDTGNKWLRKNGTYGFACYSSTQSGTGPLTLYKKSDGRPAAGLAYAEADKKKLAKLGDAFTAPTLVNPNGLTVSYASNNTDVAEVASNGDVTIKAVGVAEITASFAGNDDYKAGSASYTIGVTSHAGTQADPYVAADVKIVIDAVETLENAYATGIVSNVVTTELPSEGYITFYFSADGATTGQQIEAYKCYGLNSAAFEALSDVETGATVVVTGNLKKYNSTYEFDANCHLVSYEAPAVPKTHIANDQANPYTVAQAIAYAADGVTYDLDDYVYVQGVVYDVKSFNNGVMNIFIKDANAENQFELYKCAGINDGNATTPFEALTDVQTGNIVIGYGQLTVFNTTYEFKQGNYLVELTRPEVAVSSVELDQSEASIEVNETVTLHATVNPDNASYKSITWSVQSGSDYASVDAGVVTGNAEGEAVIRAASTADPTKYAECTVTVTAADPTKHVVTFDATADLAENDVTTLTKSNVTIASSDLDGINNTSGNPQAYYQTFKGGNLTISCSAGNITKVELTCESSNPASGFGTVDPAGLNTTTGVWTGNAASVTFTADVKQVRINTITVTYKEDNRADAGISFEEESYPATIGVDFTAPELQNQNNVTVTYSSSNENLALVDENSGEVLIGETEGTVTITATFAGNEDYKPATASYDIVISAATPTPVYTMSFDMTRASYDAAADAQVVWNSNVVTMTADKNDGTKVTNYLAGNYSTSSPYDLLTHTRLYEKNSLTFTPKEGITITKVEWNATANGYAESLAGAETTTEWTNATVEIDGNDSKKVIITPSADGAFSAVLGKSGSNKGARVLSVVVYYQAESEKAKLNASIEIADIEMEVGDEDIILTNIAATSNPNKAAISYEITSGSEFVSIVGEKANTAFHAVAAGTAVITATIPDDLGNYTGATETFNINVAAASKLQANLAYDVTEPIVLIVGNPLTPATLTYADGFDGFDDITYESSNPNVATVTEAGVVELVENAIGTTTITATLSNSTKYYDDEASYTITVNEAGDDLSGTWTRVTAVAAGQKIIIAGTYNSKTMAMGKQNSNNRAAVLSTLEGDVLTPGATAKVFTLVNAGEGLFAIQASNGKYLNAAGTGTDNYLREADDFEAASAKWTITFDENGANIVATSTGNRNVLRYNSTNNSELFSCYAAGGQRAINIYSTTSAPEPPTPSTPDYTRGVTAGNYGTICLPQAGMIEGATLYEIGSFENNMIYVDEVIGGVMEAGKPYIFQATSEQLNVTYTSSAVEETAGHANGLYGFYNLENENATQDVPMDGKSYILYQNAYWLVSGRAAYIANFRAYIVLNDITPKAAAPGRRRVAMAVNGEQVATGMESIQPSEVSIQKVMIDGKLFIIRGEKMYNVNGQVVK